MGIDANCLVVVTSNGIGTGESDLSERLTELWLRTLSEGEIVPAKIIFLNAGIFLTTEGSPYVDLLGALEERGTEIVSCITCLTYFDRMEKVVVGRPGDMKGTTADLMAYPKVVTL